MARVIKVVLVSDDGTSQEIRIPTHETPPLKHGNVTMHTVHNNDKPKDGKGRWLEHELRWRE